jgi:hypothetical protein
MNKFPSKVAATELCLIHPKDCKIDEVPTLRMSCIKLLSAGQLEREPSTWALMILGFAGVGLMAYRRRKDSTLALTVV